MSVPPLPIADLIVAEVGATGYHPRTSGHSDNQSRTIIRDLLAECPLLAQRAASGELVAKLRHHQQVRNNDWVIDIALGTPRGTPQPPETGELIRMTEPTLIQIAIELKSIWTEHGKARKNRLRDFGAFHGHAHDYDKRVVAAAFLVVNAADCFLSPLNLDKISRDAITQHNSKNRSTHAVIKDTIDKFRDIHLRQSETDGPGLEGLGVVVIEHDNINYLQGRAKYESELAKHGHLHRPSRVSKAPPALKPGDPLHYDTMLQRICVQYTSRYK